MQNIEEKLQHITLQSEIKTDLSPEINADETVVISTLTDNLNSTFVLKQNQDNIASAKRQTTTTPHRNKPPINTRCLTRSITKPVIQRKRVILNNHKTGAAFRKMNQENLPLIMAATKTLADPSLTKTVTKSRINTNNVLSTKSGKIN